MSSLELMVHWTHTELGFGPTSPLTPTEEFVVSAPRVGWVGCWTGRGGMA